MDEKNIQSALPHNVIIENRKSLTATSIDEVDSFDEQNIVAFTSLGELTITGNGLHILKFNADTGELVVEGDINSFSYSDNVRSTGNFFSKIFR